jgi:hypothetical protein
MGKWRNKVQVHSFFFFFLLQVLHSFYLVCD